MFINPESRIGVRIEARIEPRSGSRIGARVGADWDSRLCGLPRMVQLYTQKAIVPENPLLINPESMAGYLGYLGFPEIVQLYT